MASSDSASAHESGTFSEEEHNDAAAAGAASTAAADEAASATQVTGAAAGADAAPTEAAVSDGDVDNNAIRPGTGKRTDGQAVPARDDLPVDGGRRQACPARGILCVVPALAPLTLDHGFGVLGGAETTGCLLQQRNNHKNTPRVV